MGGQSGGSEEVWTWLMGGDGSMGLGQRRV